MDFLKTIIKGSDNEYASIAEDGIAAGDITGWVDTGAYTLNALLSGSVYGGLPSNKITALAGEPSTGKTFIAIATIKQFLDSDPEARVACFLTESDISKDVLVARGIDVSRVAIFPVETVEQFRTQLMRVAVAYEELKEEDRPPFFCLLDSLGMLSTAKEMADIESGSEKRDMTRAALTKGAFRALTLKLGKINIPLLITNHVYDVVGAYIPTKKMGGGCLVAGTKIITATGNLKNIEDISIGDRVLTKDGNYPVLEIFKFDDKELYEVEFEDGYTIKCSEDHRFLIDGKWVKIIDLVNQDQSIYGINTSKEIEVSNVFEQQIYKMVS
jgi:RecA/RadA recombinase